MNKTTLLLLAAGLIGMQGCSSGGATPKADSDMSSSSSSGSGGSSSSSSSSSGTASGSSGSSGGGKTDADLALAQVFIEDLSKISKDLNSDKGLFTAMGALLAGTDSANYLAFAKQVEQSAVSGLPEQKLLGKEVQNVLTGLSITGEAIVAALVDKRITAGALDAPPGVVVTYPEPVITGFGSARVETHSFKVKQEIDLLENCEGSGRSCLIDVDADVQLIFRKGGSPGGAESGNEQTMNLPNFEMNVISLQAANDYAQANIATADNVASGTLNLRLQKAGEEFTSAEVTAQELSSKLELQLVDKSDQITISATFDISLPEAVLNVGLQPDTPTDVKLLQMKAASIGAAVKVSNADGDNVEAKLDATTAVVGNLPFSYTLGEEFQTSETGTDFLDIDGHVTASSTVSGAAIYSIDAMGGRTGGNEINAEDVSVSFGDKSYRISGTAANDGVIHSVTVTEIGTGLSLIINANEDGQRSGEVVDGQGNKYADVADIGNNSVSVTFTDDRVIQL